MWSRNKKTLTLASLPLFLNLFKRAAFSDMFKGRQQQQIDDLSALKSKSGKVEWAI